MDVELIKSPIPIIMMVIYIAIVIWMAWYQGFSKKALERKKNQTFEDYLTGGKSRNAVIVFLITCVTFYSGTTFTGRVGFFYNFGVAGLNSVITCAATGLVMYFLSEKVWPIAKKYRLSTLPDIMELRYQSRYVKMLVSLIIVCFNIIWLITEIRTLGLAMNLASGGTLPIVVGSAIAFTMVDHNERDQAVEGIDAAQVTEIIDHHRIGALETTNPIYFRNQPLGCTATIVTQLYHENRVEIEPAIAGLLCSAILSDTLMFRSPTCTPIDRYTAEELAKIAGIDIPTHAVAMFRAGSELVGRSMDDIFHIDYKSYQVKSKRIAISQVTSVNQEELHELKPQMLDYMRSSLEKSGLNMMFVMLTNIIEETTELLFVGHNAAELVQTAFQQPGGVDSITLPGVVSRKKQLVSPLLAALEDESIAD